LTALSGAPLYDGAMGDDFSSVWAGLQDRVASSDVYTKDPVRWLRRNGEEVWSQQKAIMESVRDNRYTAVHSAHDLGKSFVASRIIAWWIDTHPPGTAFVVSTAPSAAQVSAIMWREVGKIHKAANLPGRINRAGYPQWYLDGELVGYGRKPADYEQSAFQGIHAEFVLVVIDEACGVSQHLYDAVDALATNENARVLAIGNPDDPASHFASVCKPDSGWEVIHLDGLRSPNITEERVIGPDPTNPKYPLLAALMEAEGIPYSTEAVPRAMRPMLINEQWIEERIQRWANIGPSMARGLSWPALCAKVQTACEGSNLFTAKVRGVFPTSASEGVIPLGWVQRATERWRDLQADKRIESLKAESAGAFVLGVDVARSGDDETCFAHRYGNYVPRLERMRITDTMEIADRVAAYMHEPGAKAVIDVIGVGAGVYDAMRRFKSSGTCVGTPVPFNAAAQSGRRDLLGQFRFLNDRAAAWWNLRELLDPSRGSNLALPDDEALIEELVAPKWVHHVGGKIKVEGKEDIKRRIGRSTDAADAVIAAFWISGDTGASEFVAYSRLPVPERRAPRRGAVIPYEQSGGLDGDSWEALIGLSGGGLDFSDL
jgi:hypothetical protein